MANHFNDFLKSEEGISFVTQVTEAGPVEGTLQENLETLYKEAADEMSVATVIRTYDPMLAELHKFVVNGAVVMKQFGAAHRYKTDSKEHYIDKNPTIEEILDSMADERAYHDTMYDTGRETISDKSASEQAFTVVGLFNNANKAVITGDTKLALKLLKDGVSTGIRALEEAQLPGSIAEKARKHAQEKAALN